MGLAALLITGYRHIILLNSLQFFGSFLTEKSVVWHGREIDMNSLKRFSIKIAFVSSLNICNIFLDFIPDIFRSGIKEDKVSTVNLLLSTLKTKVWCTLETVLSRFVFLHNYYLDANFSSSVVCVIHQIPTVLGCNCSSAKPDGWKPCSLNASSDNGFIFHWVHLVMKWGSSRFVGYELGYNVQSYLQERFFEVCC